MNRSNYKVGTVQGAANLSIAAATVAAGNSNSPGTRYIHGVYAANRNAAARYIWVSTASAGGAILAGMVFYIPAASSTFIGTKELGDAGISCQGNTGIFVSVSTSSTAFSAGTDADHDITVYYTSA